MIRVVNVAKPPVPPGIFHAGCQRLAASNLATNWRQASARLAAALANVTPPRQTASIFFSRVTHHD
jgi:hypothetical protein